MDGVNRRSWWLSASTRRTGRDRTAWAVGLLLSLGLHVVAFAAWRHAGPPVEARAPARRAASLVVAAVAPPPGPRPVVPAAIPPPPVPVRLSVTSFAEPTMVPALLTSASLRPNSPPSVDPPAAPREMPGLPAGVGDAGYLPPVPVSILPDWALPRTVRGTSILVRVYVNRVGRATGLVELDPPTADRGFNQRLVDRVRTLRYRPALENGRPTAGWAEIRFAFCETSVTATSGTANPPRGGGRRWRDEIACASGS